MNEYKLNRANEIIQTQNAINAMCNILSYSPRLVKQKTFLTGDYRSISFSILDDITRQGLVSAIKDYLKKRSEELDEELKSL